MNNVIIQLHGFGGRPDSFDLFNSKLQQKSQNFHFFTPDLYDASVFSSTEGLDQWRNDFFKYTESLKMTTKPWLMGYSMGGRLAIHALLKWQSLFSGAILLSSSPGLFTPEEKQVRQQWDLNWDKKFQNLKYEQLNKEWSALPVFAGSETVQLRSDISMNILGQNLVQWSPSQHLFEQDELRGIECPLLWISGEKDVKYSALYKIMKRDGIPGDFKIVPDAGHRLLALQGEGITNTVYEFIETHGMRESHHE